MTTLRNLKGTSDYLAGEQRLRRDFVRKLESVFEKYGYQPVETPIICCFDVLASKYSGGAEILKEVYRLSDRGKRELGLRYDLTVPFSRLVGMNPDLRLPFKRYEIGKVFRDGPVKAGRNREFTQCDVDVAGVGSLMAEAELMAMAVEIFETLGLDFYISFNNRKLLAGMTESAGIDRESAPAVILSLDKLEKIGIDGVKEELGLIGINREKADKLLEYVQMEPDGLISALNKGKINTLVEQGLNELAELGEYIDALRIKSRLRFTPGLARGLEIYTGTVWEVFLSDSSITSSIGAGGRYDDIIGRFLGNGTDYPAAGMTFGLDIIYEALTTDNGFTVTPPVDLYVIPLGTRKECMRIVSELRKAGAKTDIDMTGRRLKKSLDYVNKSCIPYAVIIGEDELASGSVRLKEMGSGTERVTEIARIADELRGEG